MFLFLLTAMLDISFIKTVFALFVAGHGLRKLFAQKVNCSESALFPKIVSLARCWQLNATLYNVSN